VRRSVSQYELSQVSVDGLVCIGALLQEEGRDETPLRFR